MVPSIEGEFARKRRMMSHAWPIVLRGGMLSPRGYGLGYGLMILSHRLLRYATPALHLLALIASFALVASGAGLLYLVALALQLALLAAAGLAGTVRARPLLSRATTCSPPPRSPPACGTGCATAPRRGWDAAEGTR